MLIMVKETMAKMIKNISIAILAITTTICVATVAKNVVSTTKNVNNTLNDVKEVLNTNLNKVIKYLITPQSAVINEPIDTSPENSVDSLGTNSLLTLDNLSPDLFQYVLLPGQQINHKIYDQAPLEKLASNLFNPAINSLTNEAKELMNNIVNDENNPTRTALIAVIDKNLEHFVNEASKIITDEHNPFRQELLSIFKDLFPELKDAEITELLKNTNTTLIRLNEFLKDKPGTIKLGIAACKLINLFRTPKPLDSKVVASEKNSTNEKANINNNNSQANANNNANNVENKLSNINDNILDNELDSNKNEEPAKKGFLASLISFFSSTTNNNSVV